MTVPVLQPPAAELDATPPYASWSRRVVAALLDGAVLTGVTRLVVGDAFAPPSLQPTVGIGMPGGSELAPWTSSVVLVGVWLTMLVLQGLTGQTPGRRVMGVAVVRATSDGFPLDGRPGVLRCVARWCAHLLDAILLLGYLRPLWHRERRTFADSIAGTVVVRRPWWPEPGADRDVAWRRTAAVTVGAFVLVAAGVATGATFGQTGGVEHLAHTECALTPHVSRSLVHVDSVDLSVDRQWTSDVRLWSRPDDAAEERRVVSVQVAWQGPTTSVEPPRELLIRTTSPGGTVDNTVDLAAGSATLPVERAGSGTVDVEILLDGTPLTSCSATVPAVPGDAGGGQE